MGAIVSCLGGELACCFGSMACKCCFSLLGATMSQSTRVSYAAMFMLNSLLAWLMLTDWAIKQLKQHFDSDRYYKIDCKEGLCYGTLATYRITMALSVFHLLMAALTYRVKSTKQPRAAIQNGYWGVKLGALALLTVLGFYLPNELVMFYGSVAGVAAAVFILIQLVLLIDLAYKWSERCLQAYEESDDRRWVLLLAITAILMMVGSIVWTGLMYSWHGQQGCQLNQFFITWNLILGFIACVSAIHPAVQEHNPQSGLPQAAVLVLYTTYLVYSALTSEPQNPCNANVESQRPRTTQVVIGVLLTFGSLVYSTSTAAVRGSAFTSGGEEGIALVSPSDNDGVGHDVNNEDFDDEQDACAYNYSFFHLVFAVASMYVAMLLTNWDQIKAGAGGGDDGPLTIGRSWEAVWVKMITSWIAVLMYLWTLVAPILLPDRFDH